MRRSQFGTFDTREDRRELLILLDKLGSGLPDEEAKKKRAVWLQGLARRSANFPGAPIQVNPQQCTCVGAYDIFVHIVGVLGVSIDDAARELERTVRAA